MDALQTIGKGTLVEYNSENYVTSSQQGTINFAASEMTVNDAKPVCYENFSFANSILLGPETGILCTTDPH